MGCFGPVYFLRMNPAGFLDVSNSAEAVDLKKETTIPLCCVNERGVFVVYSEHRLS
jgi:hypothetical protein